MCWLVLARIYAERGEFDRVCESARAALAIVPDLADAYSRLALTLKSRMPAAEVQAMERLVKRDGLSDRSRSLLRFGLAAILDAGGFHEEAAAHLEPANALQCRAKAARGVVNDADGHSRYIERIIATFTPERLARGRRSGDPDPRPVFVVGLPRAPVQPWSSRSWHPTPRFTVLVSYMICLWFFVARFRGWSAIRLVIRLTRSTTLAPTRHGRRPGAICNA